MDEVWPPLCLGPMDTEQGFINTLQRVTWPRERERLWRRWCICLRVLFRGGHASSRVAALLRGLSKLVPAPGSVEWLDGFPACLLHVSFHSVIWPDDLHTVLFFTLCNHCSILNQCDWLSETNPPSLNAGSAKFWHWGKKKVLSRNSGNYFRISVEIGTVAWKL